MPADFKVFLHTANGRYAGANRTGKTGFNVKKYHSDTVTVETAAEDYFSHTDNVGDARLNQYLSENRAKVIYSYLLRKEIASNRLRHRGYGQSKPVSSNDNEDNKSLNRRVEFVVLEN